MLSSGDTNTSIEPSCASAMWLTLISCGTGIANCMSEVATGRCAHHHVAPATAASTNAPPSHSKIGVRRGAAAVARAAFVASVPESALNANDKSRADWKRCSGLFSRHRRTIRSSAGETRCAGSDSSGGSSFKTAVIVSTAVSRRNARVPESISYSTAPNAKMSARASAGSPRTCSGAI